MLCNSTLTTDSQIYETFFKRVYNYIWYRVNNYEVCEDLTSQVFEKVLLKIQCFDSLKAPLEVWIITIARNVVTDWFRKKGKMPRLSSLDEFDLELVSSFKNDEKILIDREEKRMLGIALKKLNDKQKNMIALKYAAGLKNIEISQIMGISESNVGVQLHRCLKKLKKALLDGGYIYGI